MAKAKIIHRYLLCFLIGCCTVGTGYLSNANAQESTAPTVPCFGDSEAGQREALARTFGAEVGVKEMGAPNSGARVEEYLKAVKLGKGYAWCAAFVSWCFIEAGIEAPASAWVPSFARTANMVYKRGEFLTKIPEKGDVFMIWFKRLNRPAHIGFVEYWGNKIVITVEGNTNDDGSREGDGVHRKRRLQRQVWVVCDFVNNAP